MARPVKPFGKRTAFIMSPGIDKLPERIRAYTVRKQNDYGQAVHEKVVSNTPVDVGTARSNWVIRIGRPFDLIYKAYAPGSHLGVGETANRAAALRQAAAQLGGNKSGQPIYITNNVPYIRRLNDGWSRQAPANFVQRSIVEGVNEARAKPTRF